jgi:hypothetical protein
MFVHVFSHVFIGQNALFINAFGDTGKMAMLRAINSQREWRIIMVQHGRD